MGRSEALRFRDYSDIPMNQNINVVLWGIDEPKEPGSDYNSWRYVYGIRWASNLCVVAMAMSGD